MVVGRNICFHVAAFRDSLLFDIQHEYVLKKLNFYLLTQSLRSRGAGKGVCSQNICYHAAALVIPFNLICNMTMF